MGSKLALVHSKIVGQHPPSTAKFASMLLRKRPFLKTAKAHGGERTGCQTGRTGGPGPPRRGPEDAAVIPWGDRWEDALCEPHCSMRAAAPHVDLDALPTRYFRRTSRMIHSSWPQRRPRAKYIPHLGDLSREARHAANACQMGVWGASLRSEPLPEPVWGNRDSPCIEDRQIARENQDAYGD